ncbi:MAG: hypothetical protein ACI4U3_04105 [Traorella sp.]
MYKKIIKIFLGISILLTLLIILSLSISHYRLTKYNNSVVNDEIIDYHDIEYLFTKTNQDTIYVFLYDKQDEDCIYLDEVLLKEISNKHNGIKFEDIYKVEYEQSYRSYISQIIKNSYNISSFPAIVSLQKTENGFIQIDCFEYTSDQNTNLTNLENYLNRNHFFEITQKN